jgi:hypothetical protein
MAAQNPFTLGVNIIYNVQCIYLGQRALHQSRRQITDGNLTGLGFLDSSLTRTTLLPEEDLSNPIWAWILIKTTREGRYASPVMVQYIDCHWHAMALLRPPPHELNPPSANEISTDNAEKFVLLEKPEKERRHQLPPPRREICLIFAKLGLFFFVAISYLSCCFIVHHHPVPIGQKILGLPFLHCEQ